MKEQKRNKKIGFRILACAVLAISLVILLQQKQWLFSNPLKHYAFQATTYAVRDSRGNTLVVDNSNQDILKLSPSGELLWKITASKNTFDSARSISTDGEGNVYVYDVQVSHGVRMAGEQILKFSPDGKFLEKITGWKAPGVCVREQVVGLMSGQEEVLYIKKGDNSLAVFRANTQKLISAKIPDAEASVLSAAYEEASGFLYYSTYDGKIWRYEEENEDICLYDSDDVEGSIPQKISYADGILYVTDIGLRDTICIDTKKETVSRLAVFEERPEREIAYSLCADHGLVTVTSYSVLLWSGEEYEQLWDVPLSYGIKVRMVAVWIALLLAVAAGLYLLAWLLSFVFVGSNLYTKVAFAIASGVAALSLILTGTLFPGIREQLLDGIYDRINLAASITLEELPVDSFQKLRKPSDFMNEDYKKVQQALGKVFFVGSQEAEDLYCVMYQVIDGTVTLSYTIEDISSAYPYDWELDEGMQKVMDYGQVQRYTSNTSSGSYLFTHNPIYDESGSVCGIIEVGTDLKNVYSQLSRIFVLLAINVIAMTIVAIMFVIELMYYVKGRSEYKRQKQEALSKPLPAEIFRFIVFLIFFFTNLTCAILPLHAMRIAKTAHAFGLSPTMLSAIPISAEVVSGAIFSAIGGRIIHKLGAKRSVYVSAVVFTAGLAIRVIPDIWVLTLSSVLLGFGWGILLLLVNTMIAVLPEEEKDKGYTYYSVSSLSGANCAIVFGGFLVQWFSYSVLFAITAVLSIVLFLVSRVYLTEEVSQDQEMPQEGQGKKGRMSLLAFLFKPRIIGFFVLMLVPFLICGYFLTYLFPIIGTEWGLSETYVGYSFILSGIWSMAFSTPMTGFFSKRKLKPLGLTAAAILYVISFLIVIAMQNAVSLMIALVLIGIADSFGIPLLTSYFTDLGEVEQYGYDKGLGVYSLFENGAQSLGSFVFGGVLIAGIAKGLMTVLLVLLVASLLFLLNTAIFREKKKV